MYRYKSRRGDQAALKERIKGIAETRVRYGYRRIYVLLRREGWLINEKRVHRLYREMSLQLRHKSPKRRVKAKLRDDRQAATGSNEVWAMDFVHDQTALGSKIRILTIVDTFTRFSPAVEPRFRFTGADVVETLERVGKCYGLPKVIRVDQGSEFVSRDLDLWAYQRGVTLDFSRSGNQRTTSSSSRSTASSDRSASTRTGSCALPTRRRSARLGVETTTRFVHTARSATNRRPRSSNGQRRTAPADRNRPENLVLAEVTSGGGSI